MILLLIHYGGSIGSLATIDREPRQAWKGAAVTVDTCAEVSLLELPPMMTKSMSYLALARKWRPRTLAQLIGQDHVNKALINALDQQRLHHAYLFTGTRGVGKTSVARIFSKALNCEQGISATPCLECAACLAIEQGRFIDLIEIDGASKTRVEDTKELLDNVQYATTSGRFKIYLIDEVHMLSTHSFNALLKTLEEPPAHVKFILATTEVQKLPETILSRCLQFHLKPISIALLSQHLQMVLTEEGLEFESKALDLLAKAARGSMRDALSLLDQSITSCGEQLTLSDAKMVLGYTQQDDAINILFALAEQNASALIQISHHIACEGGQFQYVLNELLDYCHQMIVCQIVGDDNPLISPSNEVSLLAQQFSAEDLQLFYQIGLKGCEEIHLAPTMAIGFNMTLLRMLFFRPAPLAPLKSNQRLMSQDLPVTAVIETVESQDKRHNEPSVKPQARPLSIGDDFDWADLITQLKLTGLAQTALEHAEFVEKNEKEVFLNIDKGHRSLFTAAIQSRIEAALTQVYQSPMKLILQVNEAVHDTPVQQKKRVNQAQQELAESALHGDSFFNQLREEFSAELVKNSIVLLEKHV